LAQSYNRDFAAWGVSERLVLPKGSVMAVLQIHTGANQGQVLALNGDKTVLGRNPDCHIVISGTAVSRAHAHILRVQDRYYIEDIKSRNGTFVNNEQIAGRTQLKNNDRIKICDFVCSFHDEPPRTLPEEPLSEVEEAATEPANPIEATVSHSSSKQILEAQPAEKLKAILDITTNLSRTLELDSLLPQIVDSLFQLFKNADRCFIILRDEASKKLIPKVIKTRRPNDEANARFSKSIVNKCLEGVEAILSEDATSDARFAMSQSIADFRLRSVMCAPLWTPGDSKGVGVIQLDSQDRSKRFTQDDLKLLMGVAAQASVALDNVKMHQDLLVKERLKRDLELAREVQLGFLPSRVPELPGYEFFAYYDPASEVGGDYYDFIPLPGNRLAVLLGDVAGKGIPAALLMAKISADARFCMLTKPKPAEAVTHLNALMNQSALAERFVTLAAMVLDYERHVVTLVNAGHPSPVLYHRTGRTLEEATTNEVTGLPLGILDGHEYTSCEVALQPGDCLVAFSDGLTEAMDVNNTQLQLKGIFSALQGTDLSARGVGERLLKTVTQHAAGQSQHDDLTLVSFGRVGG
jgi:serine phosphatase RsbU (regulator of sigma subunit)/pSer/pThr/pTyr-binding forkhead associated (FHA) protein